MMKISGYGTLAVVFLCLWTGLAFDFYLDADSTKCFSEHIMSVDLLVVGKYNMKHKGLKPDEYVMEYVEKYGKSEQNVFIKVISPEGQVLVKEEAVGKGKFAFVSEEPGDYEFCFINNVENSHTAVGHFAKLSFRIKMGVDAMDKKQMTLTKDLEPVEQGLEMVKMRLRDIHSAYYHFRERDTEHKETSESTKTRIMFMGVVEIIIAVSITIWQIMYLRHFFKQKKLV